MEHIPTRYKAFVLKAGSSSASPRVQHIVPGLRHPRHGCGPVIREPRDIPAPLIHPAILPDMAEPATQFPMQGFIYFDITDHARLPARFFGATRNVLARL